MAEKLNINSDKLAEQEADHEVRQHESVVRNNKKEELKNVTESSGEESKANIDKIAKKVEQEAQSSEDLIAKTENNQHASSDNNKNTSAFPEFGGKQAIKRVQKHLKPAERTFSKIIHNPIVETVSDITGNTLARPSGLLYGGLFSLTASIALYLVTKHYGYEYSFFVAIIIFAGGFIFGLFVEILSRLLKKSS